MLAHGRECARRVGRYLPKWQRDEYRPHVDVGSR